MNNGMSERFIRITRLLKIIAGVLGLLLLVLAAIGSRWPPNVLWLVKDRVLGGMIGLVLVAASVLGSKFVSAYKATAVILLNTFLLLAGLELTNAVFETIHNSDDEDQDVQNEAIKSRPIQKKHSDEFNKLNNQYEPFVLWRGVPFKGETITVTDKGIRDTPGSQCTQAAYTVFTFGGSAMWGAGATDSETIPSIMAGMLKEELGPVCVINYGQ